MRVALINKNPAVSRLITLSLNKIGVGYDEIDDILELQESFDCIVIDSDIEILDVDLSQHSNSVIALVPRGSQKPEFADAYLEKPFLPTEFISLFEETTSNAKPVTHVEDSATFHDFEDDLSMPDELGGFDDFELPSIDEEHKDKPDDDLENFEDLDLNDLNLDSINEDEDLPSEEDNNLLEELSKDNLDSLDELDEFSESENIKDVKEKQEELNDTLLNEELSQMQEAKENLLDEDLSEEKEEDVEDVNEIDELSSLVDEIDHMSESDSEDVGKDEDNEPKDDIIDDLLDSLDTQELDEEFTDSKKDVESKQELEIDENLIQEDELQEDELLADEIGEEVSEVTQKNIEEIHDINEIDQALMMKAFGFDGAKSEQDSLSEPKEQTQDIKAELSQKITEQIKKSLNDSALKEALKDMNIKINISFEEK
ncbi:hypothetical protein CCAL13119_04075 [Campylobacter sp. RM13119]|uniref:hypothetical protein n=1 Tax=Campylobacter californiensis TaxID=1032243 RepID=UPI0014764F8F|nr:hypothetical protein [Campylobacter sp. RM13119]MBE3606140.1 hypothetical protein [Campylobacter sp. RM13119]